LEKRWICSAKDSSDWEHQTVRWCTGQCPVCQAGSGELAALGFHRRRTVINHRTVQWCTGLSGEPMVSRANGRPCNPRATRGRANGQKGAPDSVRCANGSGSSTVGCAKTGNKSTPDCVRWCTGLSGAPVDRKQELPSWNALNGS
jgi:hypothetical protein